MPQAMAGCTPGSLDLELVKAEGTGATTHAIAKCFSSMSIGFDSLCSLTLTANGQNNFVKALWSAATTYSQVDACPTGVSLELADAASVLDANLGTLLSTSIYPAAAGVNAVAATTTGKITVTIDSVITLTFRPSAQSGSGGIFSTIGALADCNTATECASAATSCGAGRYPVAINTKTTYLCALCSSGSYSTDGDTSCTKCAAGKALEAVGSPGTAPTTCGGCDAGTFATIGSSDCRPCAPGMYQDEASKSSCKSCPTYWYSHTYGATQCVTCGNAGRPEVCGLLTTAATACTAGGSAGSGGSFTAKVASDATWFISSDLDTYSYPALLKTCTAASTLLSFTVDETCAMEIRALATTTLTDGLMCSDPSNTASAVTAYYVGTQQIMSLLSVAKGNILTIVKASDTTVTMTDIAATSYPATPAATVSGVLTVNGGALAGASVATCPAGTLASETSPLTCTPCAPGKACANSAQPASPCAAGSFSTLGQSSCTTCPDNNYYAPEAGSSECIVCASGIVSPDKTSCSTSDCGTGYQLDPATDKCECAPGYAPDTAPGTCKICDPNTYSAGGTDTCHDCPTDKYSAAGSESCGVCPAGEYKTGTTCTRCPAGTEPDADGLNYVACKDGWFNPPNGAATTAYFDKCQRCGSGNITNSARTTCDLCGKGTYSTWKNSLELISGSNYYTCAACPDGGYSGLGAKRCTPCAGGSQRNTAGDGCTKCGEGTFRTPYSSDGCNPCPAGTASKAGADSCTTCNPGQYSPVFAGLVGAASCSSCNIDTYSADPGSTTCIACPAGFSTLGEKGAAECSGCPAGTKYDSGTAKCVDCDAGTYQDREGQKTCKLCPIGKFSFEAGSTTCDPCPAGKYSSSAGSNSCRVCPGGTFSSEGKGSCSICDKGKYSAPGSTACKSCTAGYYANKLGSRTCTACPAGSKCPGVATKTPTLCAAGSFQSKPAQTTCTPCPKKTNAAKAGATKCAACPKATTVGTVDCPARRRMLLTRLDTESF